MNHNFVENIMLLLLNLISNKMLFMSSKLVKVFFNYLDLLVGKNKYNRYYGVLEKVEKLNIPAIHLYKIRFYQVLVY